ncbi:MAG: cation:proton antiporter [Thermoanaerobaculia bacterium]
MITRAFLAIGTIMALTYATRSFVPRGTNITGSGAALAFGFLLIVAVQAAHICDRLKMPRLTGYIIIGILFGPEVAGIVSAKMLDDLALVKGTAVGLIAFLAGCELNLRQLRPRLRAIGALSVLTMVGATVLLFALFYGITYLLPVTAGFSVLERLAVALVAANVLAAYSPAVVVAILSETNARGPLSETSLSIVVLADLVIVITYALSSTFAHGVFPSEEQGGSALEMLMPHIFGSIAAGLIAGGALALYASRVGLRSGIFTFAVLFISAEAGAALHLNPLLIGLTAGLLLENVTAIGGERLSKAAESVAMPTFAIFFAVIGAEVQLQAFLHTAPYAIGAAILRGLGIWAGALVAGRMVGLDRVFARRLTFGLLPQAGVAIALVALMLADFHPWGPVVGTIVLGTIIVNQLIGPVLFRNAVVAAGEVHPEDEAKAIEEPAAEPA